MTVLKAALVVMSLLAIAFVAFWQVTKSGESEPAISMRVTVVETLPPAVEVAPTEVPTPAEDPTPTPEPSPETRTYSVQPGEGLTAICQRELPAMALADCIARIVELNSLASPDQLTVGQVLVLPPGP